MRIHAHQDVYMRIIRMDLQPHGDPKNTANEISSPRFLHRIWVLSWCSSKKTSWCKLWSLWGKLIWQHFMISMWMHTMCSSASKFAPAWWFPRTCFLLRTQMRWRNRGISCAAAWWGIEDTEIGIVWLIRKRLQWCWLARIHCRHVLATWHHCILTTCRQRWWRYSAASWRGYGADFFLSALFLFALFAFFLFVVFAYFFFLSAFFWLICLLDICFLFLFLPSLHLYSISLPPFPFFLSSLSFSFYVHHFSVSFFFVSLFFVSSFSFGEHLLLFIY